MWKWIFDKMTQLCRVHRIQLKDCILLKGQRLCLTGNSCNQSCFSSPEEYIIKDGLQVQFSAQHVVFPIISIPHEGSISSYALDITSHSFFLLRIYKSKAQACIIVIQTSAVLTYGKPILALSRCLWLKWKKWSWFIWNLCSASRCIAGKGEVFHFPLEHGTHS